MGELTKLERGLLMILFPVLFVLLLTILVSSCGCFRGFYLDFNWGIYVAIMGIINILSSFGILRTFKDIHKNDMKDYNIGVQWFSFIVWFVGLVLTIVEMGIKVKPNDVHEFLFYTAIISMISGSLLMVLLFIFILIYSEISCNCFKKNSNSSRTNLVESVTIGN